MLTGQVLTRKETMITGEVDDEAAIGVPPSGHLEEGLAVGRGDGAEGGRQAAGVGVGVAEIEDGREMTWRGHCRQ